MSDVETALSELRSRGERVTPARRAVLEVIAATPTHLDAEAIVTEVERATSGVHRATVYRTLQSLCEMGILGHTHVPGAATIYHLESAAKSHAHLQCDRCGRVVDVPAKWLDELAARAHTDLGFVIQPEHAALLGRCSECRAEAPEND